MSIGLRFLMGAVVAVLGLSVRAQDLVITPETTYHAATRSTKYTEDWPEDHGGVLYLFVKNNSATPQSVNGINVGETALPPSGTETAPEQGVHWWRAWPQEIAPGAVGWVTIKATGAPLAQGSTAELSVSAVSGATAKTTVVCNTPALRLANVLPSADRKTLYVYLRNDGAAEFQLQTLWLNEVSHALAQDPQVQVIGGTALAPGGLAILKVARDTPWPTLAPLSVRVTGTAGDAPVAVGAGLRLGDAHFAIGTWSSDLPKSPDGMAYAREVGIDCAVTGRNWKANADMASTFGIRVLSIVNEGDPKRPSAALIEEQARNSDIAAWMVRDEPELGNKPASLMLAHNQEFWTRDDDTPTYLNLMMMAGYNDYGHIPDIVCMDHYVQFAPNAIAWTGITRNAQMEEAIEYTDLLKTNTEPVRMWTWAQLAASVWDRQPHPWGVHYQFWAHVMGGAKGILWFKYGSGWENKYTPQVDAGRRLMMQFAPVRSACFYGEPLNNLRSENSNLIGRTLNSEHAVVAIVLNNNQESGGLPIRTRFSIASTNGEVTIPVPAWVPVEQVLQITPDGVTPAEHRVEAGCVVVKVALEEEMGVFLVGRKDVEAPTAVSSLQVAVKTPDLTVLTWPPSTDNIGVRHYVVYRDDASVGTTAMPLMQIRGGELPKGNYSVEAVDATGNVGPRSAPVPIG